MRLTFTSLRFVETITQSAVRAKEKKIEVKAPWGKIAALSWGNPSNPPVLLCPGRFDTCATFRPLVDLLPADFFYVGVDLPGNGLSDPFPRGAIISIMDFLETIVRIKKHFEWNEFDFIGHSLGGGISKFYNIMYPGHIKRIVELDPIGAYIAADDLRTWYLEHYEQFYSDEHYRKFNAGNENAPKYTYEEVKARLMNARGLNETVAEYILERCLESTGDGLFRLTFDQRLKLISPLPFTKETLKHLYTACKTPTLAIISTEYKELYNKFPFTTDDSAWPHRNYKHFVLNSRHDVHVHSSEECAALITVFF